MSPCGSARGRHRRVGAADRPDVRQARVIARAVLLNQSGRSGRLDTGRAGLCCVVDRWIRRTRRGRAHRSGGVAMGPR